MKWLDKSFGCRTARENVRERDTRERERQGPRLAEHDGVDGLEMGGVSDEREMHHLAARRRAVNRHAEMVLDVAGAEHVAGRVVGRHRTRHELVEDLLHRLAHDVGEDVEAASVRHPECDALAPDLHSPAPPCT
eukprot:2773669-Rhodomonas_salina.2